MISSEALSFSYEKTEDTQGKERADVLKEISMSVRKGSFVVILGQNGSGKSTLAKCFNALLLPVEGRVKVNGMDTLDEKNLWDIRSTVGMVFQNPDNQIVSSIVEEDVAFGPENLGVPSGEIRRRVDRALKAVGLYELRARSSHNLSGGQKQRQAIAGVLAMQPECIIFDEATAMLDPQGRKDVLEIIGELRKQGITIILITHFMEESVRADRVIVMNEGKIIQDGTPEEVFSSEQNIRSAGLELPHVVRIRNMLIDNGLELSAHIMDMEGLADALIQEKQRNSSAPDTAAPHDRIESENTGTGGTEGTLSSDGGLIHEN